MRSELGNRFPVMLTERVWDPSVAGGFHKKEELRNLTAALYKPYLVESRITI